MILTHSENETQKLGSEFGKGLPKNSILALFGEVGCGKTTFIKGVAQGISGYPSDAVHSPTFNLLNIYQCDKNIFHFDLYRLQNGEEFFKMGFDEYFFAGGITCIEWPESIATLLPKATIKLFFTHLEPNIRKIKFQT